MNINEEYYQISGEILSSFPKFRPPVDLFRFREDIAVLAPYCVKGSRLTSEQVDEVAQLCAEGDLFVSRSDHHIYSRHIVKQLDLVLQDNNLKEAEIADICIRALLMRCSDFFEQPVKTLFEPLYRDVMVVTEYLWSDKHHISTFMETVVLRRDFDAACGQILDRVVAAVVAELELVGGTAKGVTNKLMPKADARDRERTHEFAHQSNFRSQGGRVAGAVGKEHALCPAGLGLRSAEVRRHRQRLKTGLAQAAQNVPLDAIIIHQQGQARAAPWDQSFQWRR